MRLVEGNSGRIAIIDRYDSYMPETEVFSELDYTVDVYEGDLKDIDAKVEFAQDAMGIMLRMTEFGPETFKRLPNGKYLVRYGAGYDNINVPAASEYGVMVCNVRGYASHPVSDHALALLLAGVRSLHRAPVHFYSDYSAPPTWSMPNVCDMTLGIVGLGHIGGMLSRKAQCLFKRVIATDPYVPSERFREVGAEESNFDIVLRESDAISVHCNLTEETRGMFDHGAFERMKTDAVFINTARGAVHVESALLDALNSGKLLAAAIDVWAEEPPRAHSQPLIDHPRLIPTGHYAWYSNTSQTELQTRAARNMAAMLRGEIPDDCLNRAAFT